VVLKVVNTTKADLGVAEEEDLTLQEAFNNNLRHPAVEEVMEVAHLGVRTEEDSLVEVSSQEEEEVVAHNPLLPIHMVDLLTHANVNLTLPHRRS